MKTCCKCKVERPFSQFSRDKRRSDGWRPECKVCRANYYQNNREKIIAQMAEYRCRPGVAEKIVRQHKSYDARRFFYKTAMNLKIRAASKDQIATTAEISSLWKQQRGVCPLSGRRLKRETAQLDHIVPLKRGGSDLKDNLRWVHRDVNYAKRDLMDEDFFRLCWDVVANFKKPAKSKRLDGDPKEDRQCRIHY